MTNLRPPFYIVVWHNLPLKNLDIGIQSFLNLLSSCILYCEGGRVIILCTVLRGREGYHPVYTVL